MGIFWDGWYASKQSMLSMNDFSSQPDSVGFAPVCTKHLLGVGGDYKSFFLSEVFISVRRGEEEGWTGGRQKEITWVEPVQKAYLQVWGSSIGVRRPLNPVPGSEGEEQVLPDQVLCLWQREAFGLLRL